MTDYYIMCALLNNNKAFVALSPLFKGMKHFFYGEFFINCGYRLKNYKKTCIVMLAISQPQS